MESQSSETNIIISNSEKGNGQENKDIKNESNNDNLSDPEDIVLSISRSNFLDTNVKFLNNKRRQQTSSIFSFGREYCKSYQPMQVTKKNGSRIEKDVGDFKINKYRNSSSNVFRTQDGKSQIDHQYYDDIDEKRKQRTNKEVEVKVEDSAYINSMLQARLTREKVLGSSIQM